MNQIYDIIGLTHVSEHSRLYVVTSTAVFEINTNCKNEDSDEELFEVEETKGFSPTLKVKFKKEVLACCRAKNSQVHSLYTLHKKNSKHIFIEETDLTSFQCINPNVYDVELMEEYAGECKAWMTSTIDSELIFHYWDRTYRIQMDSSPPYSAEIISASTKVELFLHHQLLRPKLESKDMIAKIIDLQKVLVNESASPVFGFETINDLVFLSSEELVLALNQLHYYSKNGKEVVKLCHYDISHIQSFCVLDNSNYAYVITFYGSIYKVSLKKRDQQTGVTQELAVKTFDTLIETSKELELLLDQRTTLEDELLQLQTCLKGECQYSYEIRILDNNLGTEMEVSIISHSDGIILENWHCCIFLFGTCHDMAMPKGKFNGMKWKVKVPLHKNVQISDLPLKLTIMYYLKKQNQNILMADAGHSIVLSSIDFLRINSIMTEDETLGTPHEDNNESFEDFVSSINSQKALYPPELSYNLPDVDKSILLNLDLECLSSAYFFKTLKEINETVFEINATLFEKQVKIKVKKTDSAIEIHMFCINLDILLQLKRDILRSCNASAIMFDSEKISILSNLQTVMAKKISEERLRLCYQNLRHLTTEARMDGPMCQKLS